MPRPFFAHSFDPNGERWCVLNSENQIVSDTDLEYRQAHLMAREMNEEADNDRQLIAQSQHR